MPIRTLPTLWSEIRYSEKKNRLSVAIETSQNSVRAVLKAKAPRKTRRPVTTRGSSVVGTAWGTSVPAMPAAMVWSMVVLGVERLDSVTTMCQTHDGASTFRR